MKFFRKYFTLLIAVLITVSISVPAYAHDITPFSDSGEIMSVAHFGNTMDYPAHSSEAVKSAFEIGADFVSVEIRKTADDVYVLSDSDNLGTITSDGYSMLISLLPYEQIKQLHLKTKSGAASEFSPCELSDILKIAVAYDKSVIIDGAWEYKEDVFRLITECDAAENAIIRTNKSAKEIKAFVSDTSSICRVIGQYHGNILFSARSYITSLSESGCSMIYLGTKNSFGVIFRSGVLSAFGKTGFSSRAAMKTYDEEESGGRPDSESTWDDLIDRGYSVIETDRIADLTSYITKLENERTSLFNLLGQAKSVDTAFLNSTSKKALESSISKSESKLTSIASFKTLSLTKTELNSALENKVTLDSPENSSKGVFSVTFGKVMAIVIVTAAIVAVQIYFYYMQADKKMPKFMKKRIKK